MTPRQTIERARGLRRRLTPPEARLWIQLKGGALGGFKFRRQHPVDPFILDFYCAQARLAVEIDGMSHDHADRVMADERRTARLRAQGIETIRFPAEEVRTNLEGVLQVILATAERRTGG